MQKPKISVVFPVYNNEKHLKEAIESILNQTFKDFECIIINDGSTDNSEKIILAYKKKDKRIRYIKNNKNIGLSKTLNKSINLAQGEYIARMDADDISLPQRFEIQVKFMDENPEIGLCGTKAIFFEKNSIIYIPDKDEFHKDIVTSMIFNCPFVHGTVLIRKSKFIKYKFSYSHTYLYAEDYKLWFEIADKIKLYNIQQVLYKYRIHPKQMTHKSYTQDVSILIREEIIEKYFNRPLTDKEKFLHQDLFYVSPFYDYNKLKDIKKWVRHIIHYKNPCIEINRLLLKKKLFNILTYFPMRILYEKKRKLRFSDISEILLHKHIGFKGKYIFIKFLCKEILKYFFKKKK